MAAARTFAQAHPGRAFMATIRRGLILELRAVWAQEEKHAGLSWEYQDMAEREAKPAARKDFTALALKYRHLARRCHNRGNELSSLHMGTFMIKDAD